MAIRSAAGRWITPATSRSASTRAITTAIFVRLRSIHRLVGVEPCSRIGCSITRFTLPPRCCEPGLARAFQRRQRGDRLRLLREEPVDGRAGARDVRAEGAELAKFVGEWRRHEVVRRERSEVAKDQGGLERGSALFVACLSPSPSVLLVHGSGRRLACLAGQNEC